MQTADLGVRAQITLAIVNAKQLIGYQQHVSIHPFLFETPRHAKHGLGTVI